MAHIREGVLMSTCVATATDMKLWALLALPGIGGNQALIDLVKHEMWDLCEELLRVAHHYCPPVPPVSDHAILQKRFNILQKQ